MLRCLRGAVCCLPLLAACGPGPPAGAPPAFSLFLGEGGGVTGEQGGARLEPSGRIFTWRAKPGSEGEEEAAGRLGPPAQRQVWERLNDSGFFENRPDEYGNWTYFIVVDTADDTWRASWSNDGGRASERMDALYRDCLRILNSADPPGTSKR